MSKRSQADIEAQLDQRWSQVHSGTLSEEDAFGAAWDWCIELGDRAMVLHPYLKKWLYFEPFNAIWKDSGYGVGKAIFVAVKGGLGAQRVPQDEGYKNKPITDWVIYLHEGKVFGPILKDEFRQRLTEGIIPADVLVWSANATEWGKADKRLLSTVQARTPKSPPKRATIAHCQGCGKMLQPQAKFCPHCGAPVGHPPGPPAVAYCIKCGAQLRQGVKFCTQCGTPAHTRKKHDTKPSTKKTKSPHESTVVSDRKNKP